MALFGLTNDQTLKVGGGAVVGALAGYFLMGERRRGGNSPLMGMVGAGIGALTGYYLSTGKVPFVGAFQSSYYYPYQQQYYNPYQYQQPPSYSSYYPQYYQQQQQYYYPYQQQYTSPNYQQQYYYPSYQYQQYTSPFDSCIQSCNQMYQY